MLYNTDIFHQHTTHTLCERYMTLLRAIAADPWQTVEALSQVDDGRPRLIGTEHQPARAASAKAALPGPPSQIEDPRVRYLLDLWGEVLGVPVTPEDNFFEVGGHSMVGVEMAARVTRDCGVRLNLVQLASQSLEQIAEALPKTVSAGGASEGLSSRMLGKVRRLFG
ncbi:MAG: hypothetical protein H0W24_01125 [Lysobacter sp.]|nr:hypothetical protein [Lysobacter sp.]